MLGNAVEFTNPRDGVPGRIEVACTVERGASGGPVGGRVWLHVRDTGEGIAPEQLERIFEPFVQADQRLTRAHAGVGGWGGANNGPNGSRARTRVWG